MWAMLGAVDNANAHAMPMTIALMR